MIRNNINKLLILTILLTCVVQFVFASGGRRNGTGGAQELLIPIGARGIALSGSYISGLTGIESIYYNPAGLDGSESKAEVAFSYMNYIADIDFSYAAIGVSFENFGALGFSVRSLNFGDIPVTTKEQMQGTGSYFSPTFMVVGLTYSNHLTDRISSGVTFNYISETIMNTSATGIAVDAGVQYNGLGSIEGLKMAVVIRNLGGQMKFDGSDLLRKAEDSNSLRGTQYYKVDAESFELPSQLELGLSYDYEISETYSALIAGSFQNNNYSNDEYKIGAEVGYKGMAFLRAGYSHINEAADVEEENLFGPAFGAGLNMKAGDLNIVVDYAYRIVNNYFDDNQVFSIIIAFWKELYKNGLALKLIKIAPKKGLFLF